MKFDHVDLNDSVTEGSAADIEDEEVTTSKKKVKKLKKKKIHFRSDYVNDGTYESSSSDEEQREKTKNQYSILDLNPVSTNFYVLIKIPDLFTFNMLPKTLANNYMLKSAIKTLG